MPPIGGREDYAALFHEAGHAEHYGCTDAELAFEFRHLGDNAVTESFAFLLEGLTASPEWLTRVLGVDEAEAAIEHARAARLVMLRRYSAKIAYEVELHGPGADLSAMPERYCEPARRADRGRRGRARPGSRTSIRASTSPATCGPGPWRWIGGPSWRSDSGTTWFEEREAGEWLRGLWSQGQRRVAEALLAEATGGALDFDRLASELVGV